MYPMSSCPERDDLALRARPRAADRGAGRAGAGLRGGQQPRPRHQLVQGPQHRGGGRAQAPGP